MNIIEKLEQEQMAGLTADRPVPEFSPGDTLRVNVKVVEGTRERIQAFEGVCIARKNAGLNSAFTVRKISYGEGVERVFPLYSPRIDSIEVVRRGRVRRAKLYYLRGRTGKRARIVERTTGRGTGKPIVPTTDDAAAGEVATADEVYAAQEAQAAVETTTAPETKAPEAEAQEAKAKSDKKPKAAKKAKGKSKAKADDKADAPAEKADGDGPDNG